MREMPAMQKSLAGREQARRGVLTGGERLPRLPPGVMPAVAVSVAKLTFSRVQEAGPFCQHVGGSVFWCSAPVPHGCVPACVTAVSWPVPTSRGAH